MIEIKDLEKRYPGEPVPVLRGVSFTIKDGELVSLMGPSGSGKTTVLNILGGLDSDYDGTVTFDGAPLKGRNDRQLSSYRSESVGFVFQTFNLLEHLTVAENVEMPTFFANSPLAIKERRERVLWCLDAVGLEHKVDHAVRLLSGGERQRVSIARALFNKPRLLLCDEPTGALDSESGKVVMDVFRRLNEDSGVTILMVTHDPSVAEQTGRTIRIADGSLQQEAEA